LIVDDCADDRELALRVLRNTGYRILQAHDAEQAQRLIAEHGNIDLLVTDFNMPGMNGVELARWFRNRCPFHEVLLVSDSPWEFEGWIDKAVWLHFLNKAMVFASLAEMVGKLLSATIPPLPGFAGGQVTHDAFVICTTC
jgi:DNA-binding NtrC family response regulator